MPVLYFIFQGWAFIISYRRKSLTKVRPIFQVKISKIFMIPNCLLHNSYQNWTWLNLTELDWTWELNYRVNSSRTGSNDYSAISCAISSAITLQFHVTETVNWFLPVSSFLQLNCRMISLSVWISAFFASMRIWGGSVNDLAL